MGAQTRASLHSWCVLSSSSGEIHIGEALLWWFKPIGSLRLWPLNTVTVWLVLHDILIEVTELIWISLILAVTAVGHQKRIYKSTWSYFSSKADQFKLLRGWREEEERAARGELVGDELQVRPLCKVNKLLSLFPFARVGVRQRLPSIVPFLFQKQNICFAARDLRLVINTVMISPSHISQVRSDNDMRSSRSRLLTSLWTIEMN